MEFLWVDLLDVVISEENVKAFIFKVSSSTGVSICMISDLCTVHRSGSQVTLWKAKKQDPAEYNATCLMVPELRMPGKKD